MTRLGERTLEIGEQGLAELRVGLGARDDLVELAARPRQLLGRLHPRLRSVGERAEERRDLFSSYPLIGSPVH